MDLEEKVKTITKEIYDDVLEMCETTFMKGRSIYADDIVPKRIIENESIWEFFLDEKESTYSTFDLQTYIALEKMIKKDKKEISDIIEELYKEWQTNEYFNYRRLTVMHEIAKFYPKEFNKEILFDVLKSFVEKIDTRDSISIAESFINVAFEDLKIIIYQDWNVGDFYKRTLISDFLDYIGFNLLSEFKNINYKNYEIILKNRSFSKDKETEKLIDNDIVINLSNFSNNEYLLEILEDSGFFERMNFIYDELKDLVDSINENFEIDYWKVFEEI